ncbi:hypothetical protein ABFS83_11G046600 [Erythranthe nasuta]
MVKALWLSLQIAFFFTASAVANYQLDQSAIVIHSNQTEKSCSYTVIIKTSCSSVSHTTDELSLAFGDAYGNEVYVSRIDDPKTRTFERCSKYVFEIKGPYLDVICYAELLRYGSDGWKPEMITIYGPDLKAIAFIFNTFLLEGMWFRMPSCISRSPPNYAFHNYALF